MRFSFISFFPFLSLMEPSTDAESLPIIVPFVDYNLFYGVEAVPGLHFEEYELIPTRRDDF